MGSAKSSLSGTDPSKPDSQASTERSVGPGSTRAPSKADTKKTGSGASGTTGGSGASGRTAPQQDPWKVAEENMAQARALFQQFEADNSKDASAGTGTKSQDGPQK
jgi:hypothetical protein